MTGSRGGAACAARAGAKSGDSGLRAAAPQTVAPWRQGRRRLRLRAWDGSGSGSGWRYSWGLLRAGSGPALPPPRGRGHFVGTRSGYSGPARSAVEAGGGDGVRPRFAGISANRPAAELDGGRGWGNTGPPPQQREAARGPLRPGPAGAASPRRGGTQGGCKTPEAAPQCHPPGRPHAGEQQMGQEARPPPFSPIAGSGNTPAPRRCCSPGWALSVTGCPAAHTLIVP